MHDTVARHGCPVILSKIAMFIARVLGQQTINLRNKIRPKVTTILLLVIKPTIAFLNQLIKITSNSLFYHLVGKHSQTNGTGYSSMWQGIYHLEDLIELGIMNLIIKISFLRFSHL